MSNTCITHDEIAVGDYVIMKNLERPRFAIKIDKIGADRRYVVGRVFSIRTFERNGMIAFNGRRKLASLRPTTSVKRIEVGS